MSRINTKFIRMVQDGITPKRIYDCKNEIGLEFLAGETGWSIKDCHELRKHFGIVFRTRDVHQSR